MSRAESSSHWIGRSFYIGTETLCQAQWSIRPSESRHATNSGAGEGRKRGIDVMNQQKVATLNRRKWYGVVQLACVTAAWSAGCGSDLETPSYETSSTSGVGGAGATTSVGPSATNAVGSPATSTSGAAATTGALSTTSAGGASSTGSGTGNTTGGDTTGGDTTGGDTTGRDGTAGFNCGRNGLMCCGNRCFGGTKCIDGMCVNDAGGEGGAAGAAGAAP